MDYTMMTFNLRCNTPSDGDNAWPNRIERAAGMIKAHAPVVVGTQEGYASMLTELHGQLEDYDWVGMGRFGGREDEHCAIFYRKDRLTAEQQGHFWLSENPETAASKSWNSYFPRMCTWAVFRDRENGREFAVFNTHLDHYSQEARDNGVKVIWDYVAKHRAGSSAPVIVMGDMNSAPGDRPIRYLRGQTEEDGPKGWLTDAYTALDGQPGLTAHSFRGGSEGEPIDYIFVSPNAQVVRTLVERSQVDGAYPSDHYPIVAVVRMD
ncbi:endonuclease/exonuclease/phosphatase family protein [Paenibacillus doosanensis]|uniref:Endonuclease/Exonuclease/phosphatase family protein n=1 Tax=Paenibacillus konkukensis TaxID=2020716 RepID=A0ABY4RMY0_9BACL|nr:MULTISPECIES: endonuclease/exonuclease/phosphatase family protein [Paenibacillus]MCS7462106.1 endonuclease/exonuclease/phosphatase family protein [Paenibacillus doosanensis]UQZ83513.1 Endonuclease/Exonuclease/phosphatase family protein [Paenibacillus konkukensis]